MIAHADVGCPRRLVPKHSEVIVIALERSCERGIKTRLAILHRANRDARRDRVDAAFAADPFLRFECLNAGAGCVGFRLRQIQHQRIAGVEADFLPLRRFHFDPRLKVAVVRHRADQPPRLVLGVRKILRNRHVFLLPVILDRGPGCCRRERKNHDRDRRRHLHHRSDVPARYCPMPGTVE